MKKFATIITVASLALPLAFAAPLAVSAATTPTTTAAKTKGTTYTIAKNGVKNFKARAYHIKKNITLPVVLVEMGQLKYIKSLAGLHF